ncbi:MAG: hypothetical protein LQ339_005674 [Xanthoria mediterranea]|nr:MAG: hypothetical protein LQ339_005674 [Xanthoria mediterranea]
MRHRSGQRSDAAENDSNRTARNRATSSQRAQKINEAKVPTSVAGQKRKAGDSLPLPPTRRRRREAPPRKKRHSYSAMHSSKGLLMASQYPHLPSVLFENPVDNLHDAIHADYSLMGESLQEDWTGNRFRLTCTPNDGAEPISTLGLGKTSKGAERAAYLDMIVKLKDSEALKKGATYLQIDKISSNTLEDEKDAKLDMYNYAARFDTTPDIVVTRSAPSKRARGPRNVCEVTIKLPEQNIEVVGRSAQQKLAEVAAALRFKEAAEKYQAEHSDQSLVVRDSTALTTDNSGKFFEYYKIIHPDATVQLVEPQVEGQSKQRLISRGIHQTQVSLNNQLIGHSVPTTTKKKAESLAYLTAALEVRKQEPEIFAGFFRALATGSGEILKPVNPVSMRVDEDCQLIMRETLLSARQAGLPEQVQDVSTDDGEAVVKTRSVRRRLSPDQLAHRTQQLERAFSDYLMDPKFAGLRRKKDELPMNQYRAQVLDLVSNNSYSIVVGATGSGKTTQVPQILLEDAITAGSGGLCNIICTQPRRIAATSVARRVAEERAQRLQESVGYHVRFDAKLPIHGGSITYCTTGILLQQLQHQPDEVMDGVSHLVIDEVHERDILIDFLLIILKRAMSDRGAAGKSMPKVVLMSATMDTELFASYFATKVSGQETVSCPSLSVPGRTFPVREKHLEEITNEMEQAHGNLAINLLQSDPATKDFFKVENEYRKQNPVLAKQTQLSATQPDDFVIDWKTERKLNSAGEATVSTDRDDAIVPFSLIATTIAHISKTTKEGAILVFLPGLEEMVKVQDLLSRHPLGLDFGDASRYKVHLLHSSLPAAQTEVFNEVPQGCRKIILSTNIAETSVTIPDVQYVVDTGKLREKQYDQIRRITQLKCTWISKSNSKQRAGRAGRVQNGNYYALFSAERYNKLRAVGLPEMLRSDLQEICLDVKAQAFNYPIRQFLAEALEPPSPKNVDASIMNLQALEALSDEEQITPLGRLLAALPVHPSLGKMIILGIIFRCLDPMLILGAAAAERNIFLNPLEARKEAYDAKTSFVQGSGSDHIALLNAVRELRHVRDSKGEYGMKNFAFKNFIHLNAFKTIDSTAKQIEELLVEAGLIPYTPEHMRHRSEFGDPSLNENSSKVPLVKALAIAGFHPNLATSTSTITHRTPGEANTLIHPSSVNYVNPKRKAAGADGADRVPARPGTLYAYSTMAKSNDGNTIYLRDTTECTPLMAALFGGRLARRSQNILEMDDWLPFYVTTNDKSTAFAKTAKTILKLRQALDRLLAVAFMDLKGSREKVKEARGKPGGSRGTFLADEKVRALFAEGLVEILDRDVMVREEVATRGWKGASAAKGRKTFVSAAEGKY